MESRVWDSAGMVLNRLVDADSKLGTYDWLKEKVFQTEFEGLELHHLYRALDFFEERIKTVEEALRLSENTFFDAFLENFVRKKVVSQHSALIF
jgi:hypothetical protein